MKKKALFLRLLLRDIRQNIGRFFAILLIIALGVGFFAGLKVSKTQMLATGDQYMSDHQMYDFMIASSMGLDDEGLQLLRSADAVRSADGSVSADLLVTDENGSDQVLHAMSLTGQVGTLDLLYGRLPEAPNECAADFKIFSQDDIGKTLTVSEENSENTRSLFAEREYTIVGVVRSVNYISFQRGTTTLGNGKVNGFVYLSPNGFNCDYFKEIYLTVDSEGEIYSEDYNSAIEALSLEIEALANQAADCRYQSILADINEEIDAARTEYDKGQADYQASRAETEKQLSEALIKLNESAEQLDQTEQALNTQKNILMGQLGAGQIDPLSYQVALMQVENGLNEVAEGRSVWQTEKNAYEASAAQAEAKFAEAEATLSESLRKIEEAEADRDAIDPPEVYTLTRSESNVSYATFENDISIVEGISNVFPVFFFLVAALVCMTTMTRLVGEQRTQIGVWKALGYPNRKIMGKYMIYAGSAAVIGCIGGFFAGTVVFPKVIWMAYGIMYGFAPLKYVFSLPLALISLSVSLICSVGTVWLVCRRAVAEMPAEAIRPEAPKAGKRVFLEKIPFLWKHMGFLLKVSVRNVLRYKKRFFMMLLGIGGCTALLVTGLGLHDSIQGVAEQQFDEISVYDAEVIFSDAPDGNAREAFLSRCADSVGNALFVHKGSITVASDERMKETNLIVTENGASVKDFWKLYDGNVQLALPEKGGALINRKLSEQFGLSVGDFLTLRDSNLRETTVKIGGIFDNYIDSYVFLSAETCEAGWGYVPEFSTAFVNFTSDRELHEAAAKVLGDETVTRVSVSRDSMENLSESLKSLNYVVALVIACAGMLAFIVLFNLTNINITERIREIATVKVLGFYPMESAAYVFRESAILTVFSALVGLLLGKGLHAFVMHEIKIDIIYFHVQVEWYSYLAAFLLTIFFAVIVNLAVYAVIEKINMTESLKSVE